MRLVNLTTHWMCPLLLARHDVSHKSRCEEWLNLLARVLKAALYVAKMR